MSQAFDSDFDFSFDSMDPQPQSPNLASLALQRVKDPKQRNETYVLYNPSLDKEWHQWWSSTSWRQAHSTKQINFNVSKLRSPVWSVVINCAREKDGHPFIQCQRCEAILSHPAIKDSGTSTLARHPQTEECRKAAKQKGKESITIFMKKNPVCDFFDYYKDYYKSNSFSEPYSVNPFKHQLV
jgi:hypothetical protein